MEALRRAFDRRPPGPRAQRELLRRASPPGGDHQDRQRPCPSPPGRGRLAPAAVRVRAEAAGRRLRRRWASLDARGKRSTVAAVAVARKLAGWWPPCLSRASSAAMRAGPEPGAPRAKAMMRCSTSTGIAFGICGRRRSLGRRISRPKRSLIAFQRQKVEPWMLCTRQAAATDPSSRALASTRRR